MADSTGKQYVIGLDYGTDSVRALIVDASNGAEVGSAVYNYERWGKGLYCDPPNNQFRQHPADYIQGLEETVKEALRKAPANTAEKVVGIAIDTTGSTPAPMTKDGHILAELDEFSGNPNAMFILWKDHTAVAEADEINDLAHSWGGEDFTKYSGGIYSSEWFWSKILHTLRVDESIRKAAFSWVEHCDWATGLLVGNTNPLTMKRSRCAAGHKAMWHESFGGLPSQEFLTKLDPLLDGIRERLYTDTYTSDTVAGGLTKEWAERLGLPAGIPVGVGAFDAHMGAVGGEIKPYILSKVIGTSTCDMLVAPMEEMGDKRVRGIAGQVDGSIIPGMLGMEAGQSAFGDIYAWFKNLLGWPLENITGDSDAADKIIPALSEAASKLPTDKNAVLAVDWMNGRRTPDANQLLKGGIMNLNLGSDAPTVFKALVEATAFGSRRIAERFEQEGVPIRGVIALGGVAKKSPFVMQTLADVMNVEIQVAASEQTCALGAAMFAATVGGVYEKVGDAIEAMGSGFDASYAPNKNRADVLYDKLYKKYLRFGEFIENETLG